MVPLLMTMVTAVRAMRAVAVALGEKTRGRTYREDFR
jgi:hypothetical protein